MKRPPLWTWWDPPFLALLLTLSWALARAAAGPGGQAVGLVLRAPGETRRLPLTPGRHQVQGALGPSQVEVDALGRARFVASPCPAQRCVRMGATATAGESRACVPNQVLLELVGRQGPAGLDGVTQ